MHIHAKQMVNDACLNEWYMKCNIDDLDQLESMTKLVLVTTDIKHMNNANVTTRNDIITTHV